MSTEENTNFVFDKGAFGPIKTHLSTGRLAIQKAEHGYHPHDFRMDGLVFHAQKETYRHLALLILAVVFRNVSRIRLELLDPRSPIKNLVFESQFRPNDEPPSGYESRPSRFSYRPRPATRHPWINHQISPHDLPYFGLSNMRDCLVTEEDRKARDTVFGLGRDCAAVLFAELLLNFSRPKSKVDEIELEGEPGFRGVAPASAQAKLLLPGHVGFLI